MSPGARNTRLIVIRVAIATIFFIVAWRAFGQLLHANTQPPEVETARRDLLHNDTVGAHAVLNTMIARDPHNAVYYMAAAELCADTSHWDLAEQFARSGLAACRQASDDDRAGLYQELSAALVHTQPARPQMAAVAAAEQALRCSNSHDPMLLNLVGYLMADNDLQLPVAESYLAAALRQTKDRDDGSVDSRSNLAMVEDSYGWLLFREHDYDQAVDELTQATSDLSDLQSEHITPDVRRDIYYHLACADSCAGRPDDTRLALQIVLQYDPSYEPAQRDLRALDAAGQATKVLKNTKSTLEKSNNSAETLHNPDT